MPNNGMIPDEHQTNLFQSMFYAVWSHTIFIRHCTYIPQRVSTNALLQTQHFYLVDLPFIRNTGLLNRITMVTVIL